MADTSLILGGVSFGDWEIPNKINFGGKQHLATHVLLGGDRVVDAMGPDPEPIKWQGRFRGASALARAQALDEMCQSGAQVDLSWFDIFRTVVISEFHAETEKFYEIPYTIVCEVVDFGQGAGLGALAGGLDALVSADLASAVSAALGGLPGVSDLVSSLQSALDGLGGLAGASIADLTAALSAVTSASSAMDGIVSAAEAAIGGGIGAAGGVDAAGMAAWLAGQLAAVQTESSTLDVQNYVNRIGTNIALGAA